MAGFLEGNKPNLPPSGDIIPNYDSVYEAVLALANKEGHYDSTYSAVLSIYQELTGDYDTEWDSTYSIVCEIAKGVEDGSINIGGGSSEEEEEDFSPKIRFFDIDGNQVEEWTLEEAKTKTEADFPTVPNIKMDGWTLNFDGWNIPIEDINTADADIIVGAMYKPDDNKTRITLEITPENLNTVLFITMLEDCVIDWGDGTYDEPDTVNGYPSHTYETAGTKTVTISGNWGNDYYDLSYATKYFNFPIKYYFNQIIYIYCHTISNPCFVNFKNLEQITFPNISCFYNKVNFSYCVKLKCLHLPKSSVKYPNSYKYNLKSYAFQFTDNLKILSFCIYQDDFGSTFSNCHYLKYLSTNFFTKSISLQRMYSIEHINVKPSCTIYGLENFSNLKYIDLQGRLFNPSVGCFR